jgi:YVTN family beta-propeller protein
MLLSLLLALVLPTGWRLAPAGVEVPLDTFPVSAELLPDNRHALVLHAGFKPPSLAVLHLESRKVLHSLPLPEAGTHFHFDPGTSTVFVPLGHKGAVAVIRLKPDHSLELGPSFPLDGQVSTVTGAGAQLAVTLNQSVAILDVKTGAVLRRLAVPNPTRALHHNGHLYVLSRAPAALHVFSSGTWEPLPTVPLSSGPTDLLVHGATLFVAAANSSSLDVLDITNPASPRLVERLNLTPNPQWPAGITPASLRFDTSTGHIYVACSDANTVAVLDASSRRVTGYIPTAWYPTYALPLPGAGLLVLNGKGERSYPNPRGPNPTVHATMTPQPPSPIQYTPLIQTGSARLIDNITPRELSRHTRAYARLTPVLQTHKPAKLPSAIQNVIFIMKENRTYDQVLGDLGKGNGDPSLCLFPENVTPNHHKLAREFVLFDNFYVNADVSSEGWMWTSAAIVPRHTMTRWPAAYAARRRPQPAEAADQPAGGFLWNSALRTGLTFRNYGFFVTNRPGAKPGEPIVASVSDPALAPHTHPLYAGYDPGFPDQDRARIFLDEFREFEKQGQLPRLMLMVLPNDHTWGTSPGKLTPFASMADNDAALGRIVQAVSNSKFWPHTAIFVLEDDAQNGPDHVDSHRSPAFVISPYTRRGAVDSTFYNTTSMLRTIEQILKLPPLTHYDATSPAMRTAFQTKPDLTPYVAEPARVSLTAVNPPRSATAARSLQMDLSQPDRMDDGEMNQILWLAIKDSLPPSPSRAAFIGRANPRLGDR